MNNSDYHIALIQVIASNLQSESDKIIEQKVKEFEGDLKSIRDNAIAEILKNIRTTIEENKMDGGVNITINYKG